MSPQFRYRHRCSTKKSSRTRSCCKSPRMTSYSRTTVLEEELPPPPSPVPVPPQADMAIAAMDRQTVTRLVRCHHRLGNGSRGTRVPDRETRVFGRGAPRGTLRNPLGRSAPLIPTAARRHPDRTWWRCASGRADRSFRIQHLHRAPRSAFPEAWSEWYHRCPQGRQASDPR